jgi:hypothetical protein
MTIDVCGKPFNVVYREPIGRTDDNCGESDCKAAVITLDKTMPALMRDSTLIHEWLHAVLTSNAIEHPETLVAVLENELYRAGFRVKVGK